MINRRRLFIFLLLSLLIAAAFAGAEDPSSVYGRTQTRIRVRASASASAEITDNIVAGGIVYITSSKESGSITFAHLRYRASDGSVQTGWAAQKSGKTAYIRTLSDRDVKKAYGISGGDLPSKKIGTFDRRSGSSSAASASSGSSSSSSSLGSPQVKDIQTKLKALGFYSGSVTGNIGSRTKSAIRAFQKKYGLTADGIAGSSTIAKIDSVYKSRFTSSPSSSSSSSGTVNVSGTVYSLNWFKAKNNGIFRALGLVSGQTGTLKDLTTGKSLGIRVQSAGNHLDVEPRTAKDTAVLCQIYGVSSASSITSKTCYQRRPMLLTTSQGYRLVCSIYGVPHGDQVITDNGFDGQFCLHFLNSRTHGSGKVDPDHKAAIQKAVEMIGSSKVKTLESL